MEWTIRVGNLKNNPLLQRTQFVINARHPGVSVPSKLQIREQLAKIYKVSDINRIVVGNITTKFGGGYSQGFGRIYDSTAAAVKFEPNYRLARLGIAERIVKPVNRRAKKDLRNKKKKVRGTAKAKIGAPTKK